MPASQLFPLALELCVKRDNQNIRRFVFGLSSLISKDPWRILTSEESSYSLFKWILVPSSTMVRTLGFQPGKFGSTPNGTTKDRYSNKYLCKFILGITRRKTYLVNMLRQLNGLEQRSSKAQVEGSTPSRSTIFGAFLRCGNSGRE